MNEYEFEYVLEDGWYSTYRTFAACKLTAYENFISFLKECNEDPDKARVLNCYVAVAEGEEE
jgi:hypothetical protein